MNKEKTVKEIQDEILKQYYKGDPEASVYSRFHVVFVGREQGIYSDWSEAEKQVKQFSGSQHKGFRNIYEAIVAVRKWLKN